ncbi:hypothetical protein BKA81DRAFT_369138 [Phyllosticta paracitricarpa]
MISCGGCASTTPTQSVFLESVPRTTSGALDGGAITARKPTFIPAEVQACTVDQGDKATM